MPRDIRSYFGPVAASQKKSNGSVSKPQKRRVISSDEENDEKPKSSVKRSKTVQKPKKVFTILSDSEDEETIVENDRKCSKQSEVSKKNAVEKPCHAISPGDLFGKKPVVRVEETKPNRKLQKMESEFHDDDDFHAVLEQLDSSEGIATTQNAEKNKNSIRNTKMKISEDSEVVAIDFKGIKKIKLDASLEEPHNERKINKTKRSPIKNNNANSKDVTSPLSKQKSQKNREINSSLNEDIDKSNKHTDNVSKKSNFKNLPDTVASASVTKNKDIEKQSPNRKKAQAIDLFEERVKKKKQHALLYEKYLQRGGARNPGSKEIPMGAKNCLVGMSFLITGVLDSLERNEADDLIRNYGGRTVNSVSRKVNYIIVGDEAGPSKLLKANSLGIKQISEDDLLEMIRTKPEGRAENIKPVTSRAKSNAKRISNNSKSDKSPSPIKAKVLSVSPKREKTPPRSPVKTKTSSPTLKQNLDVSDNLQKILTTSIESQPLVEKYRPKTLKQIIGQQGDRSCAHNLYVWLRDWHKNQQDPKLKNATGKQNNGQSFKAALLSGPPGVGKTTTAQVVCKELGYDLLEFNASDTRNKTLLKEEVSGLLSNTTMKDYFTGTKQKITSKHVLLMDEVDGMAGNEDRGGLQELVNLIKYTDVPIICICNDRFNTKMKTMSYHSYDLRFPKLRVEQIRSFMKSLCYKENIEISTEDLDRLIESTNYDIRQVINHLEFLGGKTVYVKVTDRKHSNKDFKLGPFDVAKMAFSTEGQKNLNDKIDLYFHDYNIAPLFIQENYLNVRLSQMPLLQKLERIAAAADSISQGDLIERVMRGNMMWSLLPLHACFSFVIPISQMSGNLDSLVRFPGWFGRNSKAMRFNRLMQELTTHMRLATGVNKDALNLDYLVHVRNAIVKPLIDNGVDGIEAAISIMSKYHLMREDLDSIVEISLWPGIRDPTNNLDSKVKAAFTRAYQKNLPMLPYAINSNSAAKKRPVQDDDPMEEDDEEETDNIDSDKMIKAKKPTVTKTAASTKKTGEPAKKRGKRCGKTK